MRHRSDALAQRVIFGAGASCGTPGLPQPPRITEDQANSGHPNQERPSSVCHERRVSHSCYPAPVSDHSRSCNLQINHVVIKARLKSAPKKQQLYKLSRSVWPSNICDLRLICIGRTAAGDVGLGWMQARVYASCVSIARQRSNGFVLRGAGLQMQDMRTETTVSLFFPSPFAHEREKTQDSQTKVCAPICFYTSASR